MSTKKDTSHQSDLLKTAVHDADGSFKRPVSSFRNTIEKGGQFEAEKDRYHLYVVCLSPSYSLEPPAWATRALIVRKLKGLEDLIPVTNVSPRMGASGWPFANVDEFPAADVDPLYNSEHVSDLYFKADPNYSGRFTVPVLWDKKTHTIVNNESSEIIRIFNTAFNEFLPANKAAIDLYPQTHSAEIDFINEWVYDTVNNGVYKAGIARLEKILIGNEYLVGGTLTEADVRLWVTTIRFDIVYVGHFKCNLRTIRNGYPAINSWMKKLYWNSPAFKESTNFEHIKIHYYWSHLQINPTRIVPVGPIPNIVSCLYLTSERQYVQK